MEIFIESFNVHYLVVDVHSFEKYLIYQQDSYIYSKQYFFEKKMLIIELST